MDMGSDFDRLLIFEHARKTCEAAYLKDPLDADNLTRWGGALIELSQFQTAAESKSMIQDAIAKLEEALVVNPKKHDALWCLGNGYTTQAFLNPDIEEATPLFQKAAECFKQATEEDPSNELYMKSFEVSSKAPELHAEIHRQGMGGGLGDGGLGGGPSSASSKTTSKKNKPSDLKYDIMGWVILAVGIVAWLGYSKNHMPPPPPPPPR